jgi:hypothetical protein
MSMRTEQAIKPWTAKRKCALVLPVRQGKATLAEARHAT